MKCDSSFFLFRKLYKTILLAVMATALLLPFSVTMKVKAALPSEQTLYEESADGEVWTIKESLPNMHDRYVENPSCWYPEGTKVYTEHESVLNSMEEWQHSYAYKRENIAPVGYWMVNHRPAECIHSDDVVITGFHDITDTPYSCGSNYYSGWLAFCADCDTQLALPLMYLGKDTVSQITELDLSKGYYYHCQFCGNLEQGCEAMPHWCRGVSTNRYVVEYDYNVLDETQKMKESYHMYNNDYRYEGKVVIPQTKLNLCTFQREGYVFKEWTTNPDGTGEKYKDGAEIYNLTKENYNKNAMDGKGVITLYAQWEVLETTLVIDAGEGSYNGKKGETEIVQRYNTFYTLDESLFVPYKGYKVSFESNGGEKINPIQKDTVYRGYVTGGTDHGRMAGIMKGNSYIFCGPVGTRDKIVAVWEQQEIVLPEVSKSGYTFGGWYLDEACTKPVGTAGDSYTPTSNCTLYAKWVTLHLTAKDNYTDHDGKGAVDLEWSMPNGEGNAYVISQSIDGVTFERVYDAKDSVNPAEKSIDGTYSYTGSIKTVKIPYNGYYEVEVNGAQGGNYTAEDNTSYTGGKGSKVTAKYYFQKGEVLTLTVGGRDGYSSGGDGGEYGSPGGGFSGIYSNKQGWLIKAAGGGGGGISGNGGDADQEITFTADEKGQDGSSGGGGGGYEGGLGGIYDVHKHSEDCYKKVDGEVVYDHEENTIFELTADSNLKKISFVTEGAWITEWKKASAQTYANNGYFNGWGADTYYNHFFGSYILNGNSGISESFSDYLGSKDCLIPTYGHENLSLSVTASQSGRAAKYSYVKVYNELDECIYTFDLTDSLEKSTVSQMGQINPTLQCPLPKGTKGVYFIYEYATVTGNSHGTGGASCGWQELRFFTDTPIYDCGKHAHDGDVIDGGDCYTRVHTHEGDQDGTEPNGCYTEFTTETYTCVVTVRASAPSSTTAHCGRCGTMKSCSVKGWVIYHSLCGYVNNGGNGYYECNTCGNIVSQWGSGTSSPVTKNHEYTKSFYKTGCGLDEYALTCLIEDTVSIPSTGGKSKVLGSPISHKIESSVHEGEGEVTITAVNIGFQENTSLKGVKATDTAPPRKVENLKIDYTRSNAEKICVTFDSATDEGTTYYHKVDAYLLSTGSYLTTSNITKNTLTTGVAGYYYLLSDNKNNVSVTQSNASGYINKDMNEFFIDSESGYAYLHLVAVDCNENISVISTIGLPGGEESEEIKVRWSIFTKPLTLADDFGGRNYDSVYQKNDNTYYVKADGGTPFLVYSVSMINGFATDSYQVDNLSLYVKRMDTGGEQVISTKLPRTSLDDTSNMDSLQFLYKENGESILENAMYAVANRTERAVVTTLYRAFTLDSSLNGQVIEIYPSGSASIEEEDVEEFVLSDEVNDKENKVIVIADSDAPLIQGLDVLESDDEDIIAMIQQEDYELQATAVDNGSGISDFYLRLEYDAAFSFVVARDDDNDGVITLSSSLKNTVLGGGCTLYVCAKDNVGNITECSYTVQRLTMDATLSKTVNDGLSTYAKGEGVNLTVITKGYADRIEIEWPEVILYGNSGLPSSIDYNSVRQFEQKEKISFVLPLDMSDETIIIPVRAYKGSFEIEQYLSLDVYGTILDRIKYRIK